jgi:hypothetical protein
MRIVLTRLSDTRHALEVGRPGGGRERVELETRSCLLHDLTHFAVEAEAGITRGFWGSLASGKTFEDLMGRGGPGMAGADDVMMEVERTVAVLQGAVKAREDPTAIYDRIVSMLRVQDAEPPPWFTRPFVASVHARMRELLGRWNATRFGGAMELTWPPE